MGEPIVACIRLTHDILPALNAGRMCSSDLCKTRTIPLSTNPHRSASNAWGIMGEPKSQWRP